MFSPDNTALSKYGHPLYLCPSICGIMLIVSNLYRLVLVVEELCSTTMDLAEKKSFPLIFLIRQSTLRLWTNSQATIFRKDFSRGIPGSGIPSE